MTALIGTALLLGCLKETVGPIVADEETIAKLTITAQPGTPTQSIAEGYTTLGLATPRDGFIYIPTSYDPAEPARLLVLLHGAGGDRTQWLTPEIESFAELDAVVILAIESRYETWDVAFLGRYDPDVAFLNDALEWTFERVNVDRNLIAIGGFSDGGSEALGIGIANAGLFRKIIAFTPSIYLVPFGRGTPDVFLSHGTQDEIVAFGHSSDRVVPILRNNGMDVNFFIFDGGHVMPAYVQTAAFEWLAATQ
ncbi:MAG: alpha/beta hydrolase [Gemmatimonadaceae bacterium]